MDEIQRSPESRAEWIEYSAFDAEGTWLLFQKLKQLLSERPWSQVRHFPRPVLTLLYLAAEERRVYCSHTRHGAPLVLSYLLSLQGKNMYDFYQQHLVAYGEVLTDMEREGIQVHVCGVTTRWPLSTPSAVVVTLSNRRR